MAQQGRDSFLRIQTPGESTWTVLTGPQAGFSNMTEGETDDILETTGGGVPIRVFLFETPNLTFNVQRNADNWQALSLRNRGNIVNWEAGYGSADGGASAPKSGEKLSGTAYLKVSHSGDTEGAVMISGELLIRQGRVVGTW